jgi:hypothetical protein
VRWLLRYAPMALTAVSSGQEKRKTPNLGNGPAVRMFEIGGPEGSCTLNPPADNGALCWLSYESEMVGSAGNAPVRLFRRIFCDARSTVERPDHFPRDGSGDGSCTRGGRVYEARLNLILPAIKWWSPAGNAPA